MNARQQIDELLARFEPRVQDAFIAAMRDLSSGVNLSAMTDALRRGDLDAAIEAMNLDDAAMNNLQAVIAEAYGEGGTATAGFPAVTTGEGFRVKVRFDVRNPRAEEWLRQESSSLITRTTEAVRQDVRGVLERRLAEGQNPRTAALDIVGRVNATTGQREGGLLGLSGPQIRTVETIRQGLASRDPDAVAEAMRHYLRLGRNDKRIARSVKKLLADGKRMDAESQSRLLRHLNNSYLQLRGEMIGRTETLAALNAARDESFRQALERTNYGPQQVTKTWQSAGDGRVRHSHTVLNGTAAQGLDAPFLSPGGAMLRFPGDTSMGAGAAEVIACRCIVSYRIDVFGRGI